MSRLQQQLCLLVGALALPALLAAAAGAPASGEPVGELFASDATVRGSVVLASGGAQVMSGSSVTAGGRAALLRLRRGGEVRVCPHTTMSVSASGNGRELMLAIGTGAVEADYDLSQGSDTILTPDFRLLLAGPGRFHLAIGADSTGNTCVQSLAANAASVIVSELMGSSAYQVKPGASVLFRGGHINGASSESSSPCGCPAPAPVEVAKSQSAAGSPGGAGAVTPPAADKKILELATQSAPAPLDLPLESADIAEPDSAPPPAPANPIAPVPPPQPGKPQVEVDAPFVFRAVAPMPSVTAATISIAELRLPQFSPQVAPPPQATSTKIAAAAAPPQKKAKRHGFFRHIGNFFAALFH